MDFLIEPSKQPYKLDIASSLKSKNSEAQTGLSNLIAGILDLPDSKIPVSSIFTSVCFSIIKAILSKLEKLRKYGKLLEKK